MKKLIPLALLCAAAVAPSTAAALEEGVRRDVSIARKDAGMITAFLLASEGGPDGECVYILSWESPNWNDSVECKVHEQKTLRATSCVDNSRKDIDSVLFADKHCEGYDNFGRVKDVDFLILGQSSRGTLSGVVLFKGDHILKPMQADC
jgi:hypothetical protein